MIGIRLVAEKLTQNLIEMTELHNHLLKISGELGKAVDLKKIDIKTAVNLNAMLSEAINYTRCCTELNLDFEIGEQVLLTKRTIVTIETFCEDGMIEIDDNNEHYKVDKDELTKRV